MDRLDVRTLADDRTWEHRLFPMLLAAFAVASLATLATAAAFRQAAPSVARVPVAPAAFAPQRPTVSARGDHLVSVTVADVVVADGENSSVVLLMDGDKQWVLPIFVDVTEAEALRRGLHAERSERVRLSTATLLSHTVEMLGGKLVRVEVDDVSGESCLGQVVVKKNGSEVAIDARPEDAIAVALANGVPVFAASRVLTTRGIRRDEVLRAPGGVPTNNRAPERL